MKTNTVIMKVYTVPMKANIIIISVRGDDLILDISSYAGRAVTKANTIAIIFQEDD